MPRYTPYRFAPTRQPLEKTMVELANDPVTQSIEEAKGVDIFQVVSDTVRGTGTGGDIFSEDTTQPALTKKDSTFSSNLQSQAATGLKGRATKAVKTGLAATALGAPADKALGYAAKTAVSNPLGLASGMVSRAGQETLGFTDNKSNNIFNMVGSIIGGVVGGGVGAGVGSFAASAGLDAYGDAMDNRRFEGSRDVIEGMQGYFPGRVTAAGMMDANTLGEGWRDISSPRLTRIEETYLNQQRDKGGRTVAETPLWGGPTENLSQSVKEAYTPTQLAARDEAAGVTMFGATYYPGDQGYLTIQSMQNASVGGSPEATIGYSGEDAGFFSLSGGRSLAGDNFDSGSYEGLA